LKKKKIIEGLNVYETFVKIIFSAHIPRRMEKKNNPKKKKLTFQNKKRKKVGEWKGGKWSSVIKIKGCGRGNNKRGREIITLTTHHSINIDRHTQIPF